MPEHFFFFKNKVEPKHFWNRQPLILIWLFLDLKVYWSAEEDWLISWLWNINAIRMPRQAQSVEWKRHTFNWVSLRFQIIFAKLYCYVICIREYGMFFNRTDISHTWKRNPFANSLSALYMALVSEHQHTQACEYTWECSQECSFYLHLHWEKQFGSNEILRNYSVRQSRKNTKKLLWLFDWTKSKPYGWLARQNVKHGKYYIEIRTCSHLRSNRLRWIGSGDFSFDAKNSYFAVRTLPKSQKRNDKLWHRSFECIAKSLV